MKRKDDLGAILLCTAAALFLGVLGVDTVVARANSKDRPERTRPASGAVNEAAPPRACSPLRGQASCDHGPGAKQEGEPASYANSACACIRPQ